MRTRVRRIFAGGEPFIWLTGGALTLSLLLVAGLIGLILYNGLGFFWPRDVLRATLADGKTLTGQVVEREPVPGAAGQHRIKLKVANRDLYGADFQWVDESQITRREYPADVAVIELERGQFAFLDSGHGKLRGDKNLRCVLTVRTGKVVWDPDGLFAAEYPTTGPYSNFK